MMTKRIPTQLRTMEHSVSRYHHTAEIEQTLDDVLTPEYWTHVAKLLRPSDEIVVNAADRSWRAELLVRDTSRTAASVALISHAKFDTPAAPLQAEEGSGLAPNWGGPTWKWRAIRVADGETIKHGFQSKNDAIQWIQNHVKAQAA